MAASHLPILQRLKTSNTPTEILEVLAADGAVVVLDALSPSLLERVRAETRPWIERSAVGRDSFSGQQTTRTGALVARSPACREVVLDAMVLPLARAFLQPFASGIQLHLTQMIRLLPGQGAQALHRDRLAWGGHVPMSIEPQFKTIWAITDFTQENGATQVVPGSHRWPLERRALPNEVTQAQMPAGSVLLYSGSVIHGGGTNASQGERIGMNITYCLSWLRTEENQYLSCPPRIAKELDPQLQELLGYTMTNYALGYYSEPDAVGVIDTLPPEAALGRTPRATNHPGVFQNE